MNTDPDLEPVDLVAIAVDIGTNIAVQTIAVADMPPDWRTYPAPQALAMIGERWLREPTSAVLSVPSVVIPTERNLILNPTHADFTGSSSTDPSGSVSIPGCGRREAESMVPGVAQVRYDARTVV